MLCSTSTGEGSPLARRLLGLHEDIADSGFDIARYVETGYVKTGFCYVETGARYVETGVGYVETGVHDPKK